MADISTIIIASICMVPIFIPPSVTFSAPTFVTTGSRYLTVNDGNLDANENGSGDRKLDDDKLGESILDFSKRWQMPPGSI